MADVFGNSDQGDFYRSQLAQFHSATAGNGHSWTRALREAAFSRFSELGLPTTSDEEWKYTNVGPIARTSFVPASFARIGLEKLAPLGLAWLAENRLVCVNGHFSAELSFLEKLPPQVKAGSLRDALSGERELVAPHLGRYANYGDRAFVALNTAFMQDGVFLRVAKGATVEKPIHLVFLTTGGDGPMVSQPRNLIILEERSEATILESYLGLEDNLYLTNGVTEIALAENAVLDHTKVERESKGAFHIASLQVQQGRNARFFSHVISTGGSLVRNEVNTVLDGEGGECSLDGLFVVAERQHVDNRTRIDHLRPHCSSRELYKGVLSGAARGVFNGKIYVHKNAAKTDAKQTNNNLLLSRSASVDTKPQLEIYNNDVKCTHGSTIGQIDAQALFYLRSRGLAQTDAQRLLTYAFASEVIARIKVERVRLQLENWLLARFHGDKNSGETE